MVLYCIICLLKQWHHILYKSKKHNKWNEERERERERETYELVKKRLIFHLEMSQLFNRNSVAESKQEWISLFKYDASQTLASQSGTLKVLTSTNIHPENMKTSMVGHIALFENCIWCCLN